MINRFLENSYGIIAKKRTRFSCFMKAVGVLFCFILMNANPSCSPIKNEPVIIVDPAYPGMHAVSSKGCSFQQGANDSMASAADLEKTLMTSSFDYDYWIDTVEVTQKDYFAIMGRSPLPDTIKSGKGDDYPVSFVSWYDAALFCNAKSKKFNCDTVYSFSGRDTNLAGNTIAMTGLIIHYDRNGWRLPTEAEWEFAAREGTSEIPFPHLNDSSQAAAYAWFDRNSSNAAHPVARRTPNKWGLYDLAGNVFEWTSDWKGPYSPQTVVDPVGNVNPDGYYEKTVKGGSFKHGILFLRPSRRAATYQISLSTKGDFIGFRCARGVIPSPHYFSGDTVSVAANTFALTTSAASQFLGTTRAKLAFVNVTGDLRTLCVVNFDRSNPVPLQFTDVIDVYEPTISPDGRFVAYSSRGTGFDGPAAVSIRYVDSVGVAPWKLGAERAYVPRWLVDAFTNDTFLAYTNSAIDDQSDAWPSTATFLQKMSGGKPLGDPQQLINNGSFHDGISNLRQYAVTGYTQCIMREIINNVQHQLFVSPYNGKDASGSTQVCNVSISSDPAYPDRCLFLDFGSQNKISTLVQAAYGVHEYLFIAEFAGNTVAWYKCPNTETSWDYPEWSNNARFAVASCRNAQSDAHAIYIINLEDKSTLRVIEGTELNHPYLWTGELNNLIISSGFSPDSLGAYGDPFISGNQISFSYKMNLFWKARKSLDIVFVGSSQVLCGIDCAQLSGRSAVNMGYAGAGVLTCSEFTKNYVLPACPNVKLVGMSAGVYWIGNIDGEGDDAWKTAITQSKGYVYDLHHNFWRDSFPARFDECIALASHFGCFHCDTFGMTTDTGGSWGGSSPDVVSFPNWDWQATDSTYIKNFNALQNLIQLLAANGKQLLMINFPESPAYKNTDHFTRYGPSWATGRAVVNQLKSLETTYSNFHFYDAYKDGNHDYTDEDAGNWNHLNPRGAAKLTKRLDSLIQTIIPR